MAVVEVHSSQSDKSNENPKPKDKKERPSMKIVVRRLPPSMEKDTFLEQVSPVPDYDYFYFVRGDMSLGEHAYSRAYINFLNASDIFIFKEKFDNYVFVDQKGHEYPAVVEFAILQKGHKKRKPRYDPKCDTIENEPHYIEFLDSLKVQPNQDQKPEFSYQFNTETKEELVSTPLLDFIKQRRIDKLRIREERREQRKQRELERKKLREEDQRRRQEQRFTTKPARSSKSLDTLSENLVETVEKAVENDAEPVTEKSGTPNKDKRFSYGSTKPRFFSSAEKSDYYEKRSEFKKSTSRKDDYSREKEYRNRRYDDYKKDSPKKARKYSEKREERKNEVRMRIEDTFQESKDVTEEKQENVKQESEQLQAETTTVLENQSSVEDDVKDKSDKERSKDDPRMQRRIKNKDRPSMAIYQPGMLSKRKIDGGEGETASAAVKE